MFKQDACAKTPDAVHCLCRITGFVLLDENSNVVMGLIPRLNRWMPGFKCFKVVINIWNLHTRVSLYAATCDNIKISCYQILQLIWIPQWGSTFVDKLPSELTVWNKFLCSLFFARHNTQLYFGRLSLMIWSKQTNIKKQRFLR